MRFRPRKHVVASATGRQVVSPGDEKLRQIHVFAHRIISKVLTLLGPMR